MTHYFFKCCWTLLVNFEDFYINMRKKDGSTFFIVPDTFSMHKQGLIKLFPKYETKVANKKDGNLDGDNAK